MRTAVAAAAATCALLGGGSVAAAQESEIGGRVDGLLRLELEDTAPLTAFPAAAGTAETSLTARIVATDGPVTLSVADGDVAEGSRLGRLTAGTATLAAPLTVSGEDGAFASLGAEPVLREWSGEIGLTATRLRLRQRLTSRELRRGPYTKTVLVTASVGTP